MKCRKCSNELNKSSIICPKCGFKNTDIDGISLAISSNIIMCIFFLPMALMNFNYFVLEASINHGADGYGFFFFGTLVINTFPILLALILGILSICKYYEVKNIKTKLRKILNIFTIFMIILFIIYFIWFIGYFFG